MIVRQPQAPEGVAFAVYALSKCGEESPATRFLIYIESAPGIQDYFIRVWMKTYVAASTALLRYDIFECHPGVSYPQQKGD